MPAANYVAVNLDDAEDVQDEAPQLTQRMCVSRKGFTRVVGISFFVALSLFGLADKRVSSAGQLHAPTRKNLEEGQVCLTHVSYGQKFKEIDELTVPIKRAYAERWGYKAKIYVRETFMDLVYIDFKNCLNGNIENPLAYDKQSLLKFCGIWAAFDDGCDTVLFTDGDAVIASPETKVEHFMRKDPSADVYWSLNDPTTAPYCRGPRQKMFRGDGRDALHMFGTCLNSGTFIMRKNTWTWRYLERLLTLSNHTINDQCSTASLNPEGFDQCDFKVMGRETTPGQGVTQTKVGDQCVIACDAMQHNSDLRHFMSFGPHERPVFQFVQTQPSQVFQWLHLKPWDKDRAFVVNCAGHLVKNQKIDCVKLHASEAAKALVL